MKNELVSESKNLVLKRICIGDLDDIFELWNKEYVFEYQPFSPVKTKKEARAIITSMIAHMCNSPNKIFIIRELNSNKLLGQISYKVSSFQAEIGISLTESAIGKGISDEALRLVEKDIADKCLADSCIVNMNPRNANCYKLFSRNGYCIAVNEENNKKMTKTLEIVSSPREIVKILKSMSDLGIDYMLDNKFKSTNNGKPMTMIKVFIDKIIFELIFTFHERNTVNLNIFKKTTSGAKLGSTSVKGDLRSIISGLKLLLESEKKRYGTL